MKRPIAAIAMPEIAPGTPDTPPPVFMTVRPDELLVDETYQRDLSEASIRLIRRIVAEWDWRKFKAPVVAMTDEGPVVLDGQHTATAAATHPMIEEIPVLLVEAPEQTAQARAFVGMNTTRLGITAAQLHAANVAAGDANALAVDRACAAAGIRVLRLPPSRAVYSPRETIAVASIAGLVARRGEETAARVLGILGDAEYGPVSANQIRAVEQLLTDPEFGELDPDELPRIVRSMGIAVAEKDARAFAATHCLPAWRGLAATWFKARKGKRRAPDPIRAERDGHDAHISTAAGKGVAISEALSPQRDVAAESAARIVDPNGPEFAASAVKRDTRPARNGWVPGPLMKRCTDCHAKFVGGLKAATCADCAYRAAA